MILIRDYCHKQSFIRPYSHLVCSIFVYVTLPAVFSPSIHSFIHFSASVSFSVSLPFDRFYLYTVASIWFEIWVVVDLGQEISIFPGKFQKISIISGNFTQRNSNSFRQMFKNF